MRRERQSTTALHAEVFSTQHDTCVLVSSFLRDALLQIAQRRAYRALWSSEVLVELDRRLRTRLTTRGIDEQGAGVYVQRLIN